MNKLKTWILFCALLASASVWAASRSVIVNDAENVYSWSTPEIWSDNTPPEPGDSAYTIGGSDGNFKTSFLTIGPEDMAHTTNLVNFRVGASGYSIGSTSIVTIAEGAKITITNGWFAVGPGGSTSSKCYSKLVVNGGVISNVLSTYAFRIGLNYGTDGKNCPTMPCELIQNGGDIYMKVNYPTVNDYCTLKLQGGRFQLTSELAFNGANSAFIVDGGNYMGPFTAGGKFQLLSGCVYSQSGVVTIGNFKNGIYDPASAVGLIGGGVFSNYYPRVTDGSLLMTNGMIRYSTLQINPTAGKEAHFTMTGGAITNNSGFAFSDSGKGRVMQAGGYVNMYTSMQFNYDGDYCYTITNGTLIATCGWEPSIAARHSYCTNATFCLRGTPSVTIFKNYSKNNTATYSNRVHFAFEIDERGLAPITARPTYTQSSKTYPDDLDIMSWHTLQPYGGFQLTTTNAFALFRNAKDMGFRMNDPQARLPNVELWETGDLENDAEGHPTFGSTLKDEAAIAVTRTESFASATGLPYGWFRLPRLGIGTHEVKVSLGIEAKGTNTLDGIAAQIVRGGYAAAIAERTSETAGTVTVTLPVARAINRRNEQRNVLFDFTSYGTAYDVYEGKVTTNAVITAASLAVKEDGLMLLIR